jgi:hypothetical protein
VVWRAVVKDGGSFRRHQDDTAGHGTVLAAISSSPFRVNRFARDGHWDNRLLSEPQASDEPETLLRGLVEQMTPAGDQLVYSVATYVVSERYTRAPYVDPPPHTGDTIPGGAIE